MPFELEALVGHLYIVGKRTIHTTPPGALVEVAPRKAARGREADTYFVLVLPSGNIAPTTFYEQMAHMSAERYFSTSGAVTSALRDMLNALNHNLYEHNQTGTRPYEANIVCAVLRGTELYVARVGAAVAILRYNGQTLTYPEDLSNDEALYQPPLGVQPMPNVLLRRFTINSGSRLMLVDAAIAEVSAASLTQSLVAASLDQVIADFKLLITLQTQMMLAEFVPPDAPAPMPVTIGESTTSITQEITAARTGPPAPAPTATPTQSTPEKKKPATGQVLRRGMAQLMRAIGRIFSILGDLLETFMGRPRGPRFSPTWVTTASVTLPLLVVIVVVLSWASGVGETAFESCVGRVTEAASVARSIDSSNPQSVQAAWQGTLAIIEQCEQQRAGDLTLNGIRREAQDVIDRLNNIKRRNATTLAALPNASLHTLLLQGLDLYALDKGNDLVYRLQIAGSGMQIAGSPQPLVNMRRGAAVDGFQVGPIIDIAFDDQLNVITLLDRNGVLVRCPPRFIMECNAQRVPGSELWVNPAAITIWRGALYVLDPGANQLWRYTTSGGNYASSPTEYFTGGNRPNLAAAIDFDITRTGSGIVYILYADGTMTSHLGGQGQPFAFVAFPQGQELENTTLQSMFMNDSPVLPAFYIVSQQTRTVYQTTLAGTYQDSYRVFDESLFELLTAVVVDPAQQILYAASGNAVLALRLTN